jgi:signal transduction histidine kinase
MHKRVVVARRALWIARAAMNPKAPRKRRDALRSGAAPSPHNGNGHDFLAAVSHDLKDPLAVIVLGTGSILRRTKEKSTRSAAKLILAAAARMERLVEEILDRDLSLSLDGGPVVRGTCDAAALVHEALASFLPLATERGQWIEAKAHDRGLLVRCDADDIHRVLGNLISNAMKFSPSGTTIRVSVEPLEGEVRFCVRDSGCGIPADQLERIFDRHFQGRPGNGHGLGLAIANKIVNAHGGRIWAESMVGSGSSFWFTIPRA